MKNSLTVGADLILDGLTLKYTDLMTRRDELKGAVERAPDAVTDEETSSRMSDFIKQINLFIKSCEETQKKEKAPYLEGGRAVDTFFFGELVAPLELANADLRARQACWLVGQQKRQKPEAGEKPKVQVRGTASLTSLKTEWKSEIVSKDELDLEALLPYLGLADLEKAVRAFVKAGGRQLKGVRIWEAAKAIVR